MVVDLLAELNEDVKGFAIEKNLTQLLAEDGGDIEKQKEFWTQFSVVIVSESLPSDLLKLSDILWDLHIPLVVIDSFSFFGSIFLSVPEHTVVESHPISLVDLRLDSSWPELDKLVASYDLASLDEVDLAHVPYPVLLLKYMEAWKHNHDGSSPKTSSESASLRHLLTLCVLVPTKRTTMKQLPTPGTSIRTQLFPWKFNLSLILYRPRNHIQQHKVLGSGCCATQVCLL